MIAKKTDRQGRRLDDIVAGARRHSEARERSCREQALKMYPWVCGRCSREFTRRNVSELTVHHRDHDHDNNPADGSNWELLCRYCHDNEHSRRIDHLAGGGGTEAERHAQGTYRPFADLGRLLDEGEK